MMAVLSGFLQGAAALIGLILILSHISWWLLGEKYFPSSRVCAYVHWNFPSWFSREAKFFTSHMEKVSVFGFLSTFFLLGIVPLNTSILAQVFSLFFMENEETIILPVIGEYGVFPLLIGLLYALVEVALSAVRDYRKQLKQKYTAITLTIAAMIVVEAGLNIYRSIIMVGNPTIAKTFWDNILGVSGPLLAGFLGIVIPMATIILGAYAMIEFILPMINNVAIAVRSLSLFAWYGVLVLLFGWHPKTPLKIPESVRRLHDEANQFRHLGEGLQSRFKALQASFQRVKKNPVAHDLPTDGDLQRVGQDIQQLEQSVATAKPSGNRKSDFIYYRDVHSRPVLRRTIDETLHEIRDFTVTAGAQKSRIAKMSQVLKQSAGQHDQLQMTRTQYETEREAVEQLMTTLEQGMADTRIVEFGDAIHAALGEEPIKSKTLSTAESHELIELVNPGKTVTRQQRDYGRATADLCRTTVAAARAEIAKTVKIVQDVRKWLDGHPTQAEDADTAHLEARVELLANQLVELANRLEKSEKAMNARFDAMQKELVMLSWQLYAFISWVKLQTPLRKRI